MFLILGLLKAILTDLSGGFHPRKFKNPAEDIPVSQIARDIRDYTDLLKMSQDEMSEEQRQALLSDDEEARNANTVLHSSPSREEMAKLRPGQGEDEELVQKGYEEVVEGPDEDELAGLRQQSVPGEEKHDAEEDTSPEQEQETEDLEGSSDPIEDSYFELGLNEESFSGDSFDVDLEEPDCG